MNFHELGLGPDILKAVADAGYLEPTPIQRDAIPVILQGRDVLGCAQTGTGKTASFTLPMLEILSTGRARARMPRSLVLAPTRELATQIADNFETHGKHHKLTMALLIGGVSLGDQERKLDRGVDVLIATPGRFLDLFDRGAILLSGVNILVIDEADRMLDMGFIPDVERIVKLLPAMRQTLMFSATMPREVRILADKFLHSPKEIMVTPSASPAINVTQWLAWVKGDDKREALRAFLRSEPVENALIFCNRKRDVTILNKSLLRHDFSSAELHGDMHQSLRTETLEKFRRGEITLLVATDVAGRGLDIEGLSHVFNFDVPTHAEDYVHRIGRTGRAGRGGCAITLAAPAETKFVDAIRRLIGRDIPVHAIAGEWGAHKPALAATTDEAAEAAPTRSRRGRGRKPAKSTAETAATSRKAIKPAAPAEFMPAEPAESTPAAPVELMPAAPVRPTPAPPARPTPTPRPDRKSARRHGEVKRDRGETRDRGDKSGAERPVTGLGDHVPAFLLRGLK
jgi:superfamily II DNA/RNA helicase